MHFLVFSTLDNKQYMSHWNHRVLVQKEGDDLCFTIHEVYYDDDGRPDGYTERGIEVSAETIEALRQELKHMEECLQKPMLWGDEKFPEEWKQSE